MPQKKEGRAPDVTANPRLTVIGSASVRKRAANAGAPPVVITVVLNS